MNARDYAVEKHGEQKYGSFPYSFHLDLVVKIIQEDILTLDTFKWYDHELIINAGYLHDVLEDTKCDYDDLGHDFGYRLADLVYLVTDEPGKNRKDRKAKTYPKIRAGGPLPVAIKLADRIANVEYSLAAKDDSKFNMYFKEHVEFRDALYLGEDLINNLWYRLDDSFDVRKY